MTKPIQFTVEDLKVNRTVDADKLERVLRQFQASIETPIVSAPQKFSLQATNTQTLAEELAKLVQPQLQATGAAPINITNLLPTTGSGIVIENTHANRDALYPATKQAPGTLYYETDTQEMWLVVQSGATNVWVPIIRFIETDDVATNTITNVLTLIHRSTGLPTFGFGTGLAYHMDNASNIEKQAGFTTIEWSSAVAGIESADAVFYLMAAGANAAEKARINSGGDLTTQRDLISTRWVRFLSGSGFLGTLEHTNTGNRAYFFPDATCNMVYETAGPLIGGNFVLGDGSGDGVRDAGFAPGITGTVTLAKITGGGANGSLTFANGVITAFVNPT